MPLMFATGKRRKILFETILKFFWGAVCLFCTDVYRKENNFHLMSLEHSNNETRESRKANLSFDAC